VNTSSYPVLETRYQFEFSLQEEVGRMLPSVIRTPVAKTSYDVTQRLHFDFGGF
jgi:hypothetical protein